MKKRLFVLIAIIFIIILAPFTVMADERGNGNGDGDPVTPHRTHRTTITIDYDEE